MLETTGAGYMVPAAAVEFMDQLADKLKGEAMTEDFALQYQQALNTFRRCVAKETPLTPKLNKGRHGHRYDSYTCRRCGAGIREAVENYCWNCGQKITDAYLGRRKTKEEQKEYTRPETAAAIEEVDRMKGYDWTEGVPGGAAEGGGAA